MIETPVEVRKANSKAAVEQAKANPPPSAQEAALPEIITAEDGSISVRYPDGTEDPANSIEDAVAATRVWEQDDSNIQEQGIRMAIRHLEQSHEGSPDLAAKGNFRQSTEVTMADWAKGSKERLDQAYARVRIAQIQEGLTPSADADIDLTQYLILGSSRNTYGQGVTRIAMEVNRAQQGTSRAGSTVLTPIEEHAEGVAKYLIQSGKKSLSWLIQQIRAMEAGTKQGQTMADNIGEMEHDLQLQEAAEAFSRLAVANATGKIQDSQVPAGLKAIFRAIKETIAAILELAVDIKNFRDSGKMDADFGYWLDVAGGVNEDYTGENMMRQMEADMLAESMEGMPEIKSAIAGKLPHPETLKANGHPLAGEVAALYDEIKQSQDSGANQAARTRKANEFFLPPGDMVDLDVVRESLNERGFDFQTPTDMVDAVMLSVGYGKPQYSMGSGVETFSIGRTKQSGDASGIDPERNSGAEIDDVTGLPLNPDGTVTLYHGTTKAAAAEIVRTKLLKSDAERRVYLTTDPTAETGYGDGTIVAVHVKPDTLELDDEFPDGRQDFAIDAPKKSVRVVNAFMPFDSSSPAASGETFSISRKQAVEIRKKIEAQIPIETITDGIPTGLSAKAAVQWIEDHGATGETSHAEIGKIDIRRRCVKNAMGHLLHPAKIAALLKMKDLIPLSTVMHFRERPESADSFRLAGRIDIDGIDYVARIIIDTDENGNRYYNHELSDFTELQEMESPQTLIPGANPEGQQIGVEELEDTGKLLRWIFSVKMPGETHSIARADSPLLTAIDALVVAPEKKAEVYQRMAAKVRDIRQRFDKKRLTSSLMDLLDEEDPNARHEQLKDIATLEVVAKVLPPAIRGKLVGSFRQMDMLKSAKGREDYLIRLLPKIEQALENHLQNQFRMAIRREFDRRAIKVSESKTRGGKIGGVAHAIFEEARAAMKLKPEQAEATAEKLRDELENSPISVEICNSRLGCPPSAN